LITPNFYQFGVFPKNPMSKSDPYANQLKKMSAAASVAMKEEQ
jgi:hypothetical protein